MLPANTHFYEKSMKLWEGLEQDFNFNAMVSQRGVINLFHSDPQRDAFARRGNAMRLAGVDAEFLSPAQLKEMVPILDFENARFPIQGGLIQRAAARSGMTPWPGAMPAVPIHAASTFIQNCEVKDILIEGGAVVGVETSKGNSRQEDRHGRCRHTHTSQNGGHRAAD